MGLLSLDSNVRFINGKTMNKYILFSIILSPTYLLSLGMLDVLGSGSQELVIHASENRKACLELDSTQALSDRLSGTRPAPEEEVADCSAMGLNQNQWLYTML